MIKHKHKARLEFNKELHKQGIQSTTEKANRAKARSFAHKIENAVVYTKKKIEEAQARQQAQANKKRRTIDFDVGDKVYIIKKD